MSANASRGGAGRWPRLLLSATVLLVVAALVAGAVVALRGPGRAPTAAAESLQVGIAAPAVAVVGDTIPVTVSATGPAPLERVELWLGASMVDAADLDGSETAIGLTLHWPATEPGAIEARARAIDSSGRVGTSNAVTVVVGPMPLAHLVVDPEGASVEEIAGQAGVGAEQVVAGNPGVDPAEILPTGSLVFLPPAPQGGEETPQGQDESVAIEDATLRIGAPVDGLFLYLTFAGTVHRIPADPATVIPGHQTEVDLTPYLPPLPGGDVAVEVWARTGGGVDLLANLVVAASSLLVPATDLVAFLELWPTNTLIPVKSLTATDAETVELEWSSNVPHQSVRWVLSTKKPDAASSLHPTGILQAGVATPQEDLRRFTIDLSANVSPTVQAIPIASLPVSATPVQIPLGDSGGGLRTLPNLDPPGSAWVWVVPVDGDGQPVGPASPPVRIIITPAPFDPSLAPPFDVVSIDVAIPPAPNTSLADCVRIVSQAPRFPRGTVGLGVHLNPDGSTVEIGHGGAKITGTLPYTLDATGYAVYPFTACPGERGNFQWGSVGCGADPFCHISKGLTDLGEAAVQFGEFLADLADAVADAYNELKAWVIDQVASTICPAAVSGPCKTLIEVAVDVLLTAVGVPPTMPNFDDLAELAKGELIDLAMDQLGVGSACDALAQAGTGKSCGELATELQNLDACSFAPKGQENQCRDLVTQAAVVCQDAGATQCEFLTTTAQTLIEQGVRKAVDESIEAVQERVTNASLESIGFSNWSWSPADHACHWGGPNGEEVFCPPYTPLSLFGGEPPPTGCNLETFGADEGKVRCSYPPVATEAIPEPRGQRQPIEIRVVLFRNDNPLPDDFACGPIYAAATTVTPYGAVGQPYLAASAPIPSGDLFGIGFHTVTLRLNEPNPHVKIPEDKKPPDLAGDLVAGIIGEATDFVPGTVASNEWRYLLEAGSYVGVSVFGQCIPKSQADGPFGVAGVIPPPLSRMTPGVP